MEFKLIKLMKWFHKSVILTTDLLLKLNLQYRLQWISNIESVVTNFRTIQMVVVYIEDEKSILLIILIIMTTKNVTNSYHSMSVSL